MMKCFIRIGMLFLAINLIASLQAQTTGKITGIVTDQASGEPLVGVNIIIEGQGMGTATDADGVFFILNVPPGTYRVTAQMIGYALTTVDQLRVSVNRTATINFELKPAVVEGEVVEVVAEAVSLKKDQVGSIRNVSADQIESLPVQSVNEVINMQAGVVNGHFRGGRLYEVSYLIDGLQVDNSFDGEGRTVDVETEVVQDLEVITGTFNAEYGRAMSGVVNAVTKDGGNNFHGSASLDYSNYYTGNGDVFIGLSNGEIDRNQDYKLQLSGPLWKNKITFFTNYRYQDNKNHLNGIRRFNVNDFSDFSSSDSSQWYSENSGDGTFVPMNFSQNTTFLGKLTAKLIPRMKLSLLYNFNDDEWGGYDHSYKYNPDGRALSHRNSKLYTLNINHFLSQRLFYDLKFSYLDNSDGWYVFEDPLDSRYVHDSYLESNGPGFFTGGQQKGHSTRLTKDFNSKLDFNWQVNNTHLIKSGVLLTRHEIDNRWLSIQNDFDTRPEDQDLRFFDPEINRMVFPNYAPATFPDSSIHSDIYIVKPVEFSAYVQDKMEFDEMVLNLGVRYDYFDPATVIPSQPRNPGNQLSFLDNPERMSTYPDAKTQYQLSPRLGLSYQLGQRALLRFSYGHFFQIPPFYALYENHSFRVAPNDYVTTMGNPELKAQKTIQYEVGLWQELMPGMGLELAVYYRDIYDLLSTKIISTFNQIEYGLYTNKDYGNVKGMEVKFDWVWQKFSAYLNYTLQYTRGNADNPLQTFTRAGDSRDPIPTLIPLSWDQRHTLNLTLGYQSPRYGATLTSYFNSGVPFTWQPISENRVANLNLYPNNAVQPGGFSVDLRGFLDLLKKDNLKVRLNVLVYNLLDRLNEDWVYSQTGRAYTDIIRESDLNDHRSNFNEYIDRIENPSMFSAPRHIKAGLEIAF